MLPMKPESTTAMASTVPPLLTLPAELILQILITLEPREVASVGQTCKTLHQHSSNDWIWQTAINRHLSSPVDQAGPSESFRDLYIAHHAHWFLPRQRIWFADTEPSGKLLIARYNTEKGSIEAHAVVATRGHHTLDFWEKDREVIIHSFDPKVSLDMNQPVLELRLDSPHTDDKNDPRDKGYTPQSKYGKEVLMDTFAEAGLHSSFMLCRPLPEAAISDSTQVWPPQRLAADARVRTETRDGFQSAGHRPTRLSEVSEHNFRLRKWVEYTGRRAYPSLMSFTSPNGLAAALGIGGPYFGGNEPEGPGGMRIRMPEDVTTYATLPQRSYLPTATKPWQGIWCGDYSGHGCEFLVIQQPDKGDELPLPTRMDWLRDWFRSGRRRDSSESMRSYVSAQEELDYAEAARERVADSDIDSDYDKISEAEASSRPQRTGQIQSDESNGPSGRLEAIKLTGDPNIPRGEYSFVAPEIGNGGYIRTADEEIFKGARVVRSAGHIARRGFSHDQYTPSQLIMISHDRLAQFWEGFGHISYYQRVDLDALLNFKGASTTSQP